MERADIFFVLDKRSQESIDLICTIREKFRDSNILVVDVSHFDFPRQAPWGVGGIRENKRMVGQLIESLGVRYLDGRDVLSTVPELTRAEDEKLEIALTSSVTTYYLRGIRVSKNQGFFERRTRKRIKAAALSVFAIIDSLVKEFSPSQVFIWNARFAAPHAALLATKRHDVKAMFYELVPWQRRFYLRQYRPHDRLATQNDSEKITSKLANSEIHLLSQRSALLDVGPKAFGGFWSTSGDCWDGPKEGLALFATSNDDETFSVDLEWGEAIWENQYFAFREVWKELRIHHPLSPVLRVHPNLINKNPKHLFRELRKINRLRRDVPELTVVLPTSPVSSYELISYSSVVIIENSTIGLEASLLGKTVICTNSNAYDLMADVTRIHSPADLQTVKDLTWVANFEGATRYVAAQELLDFDLLQTRETFQLRNLPMPKKIVLSLAEGTTLSILFEARWVIFRKINIWLLRIWRKGKSKIR